MSLKEEDLEDICGRFNRVRWHDSMLISFQLLASDNQQLPNICFDIETLTNTKSNEYERSYGKIIIKECRIIQLDLDFLGMQFTGGAIADAVCERDAALKEQSERNRLQNFDLPQEGNPLDRFLYFRILLIHPGGEIKIFARDFEFI